MDAEHFDALTRSLSSAAFSRRQVLTGLTGSALGALAVTLGFAEAEATHVDCLHVGRPCRHARQCCSSRCRGPQGKKTCRAHDVGQCTAAKDFCLTSDLGCGGGSCLCFRTTGGANFCGSGDGECMACSTDAECAEALSDPGAACVDLNHGECSCDNGVSATLCARPCTA